jgi:hypothetical protein
LRVARFVAELELSEEQRYLVNYHAEYMLFRNDAIAVPFSANRYEDHRLEANAVESRDSRTSQNVRLAIDGLDPSERKHQETYKRIMARNRPAEEDHHEFDNGSGNGNGNDGGAGRPPVAQYNQLAANGNDQRLID